MKTFYIETFGCQMNTHDSEKVIGTLVEKGYRQVDKVADAELVLYNTCSIRDKAEQKVFHRLDQFKREGKGKIFGVLGCVAQQEGERIFERAPHVSLVAGSASYTKLPEMLIQLEAGNRRVTGLSLHTTETFDTPYTSRDNPHRAYITIIEGCDKACAYCVVPFTRGPERSRTSESVLREARSLAELGYTEVQLLGQNVNSYRDPSPAGWDFAKLLDETGKIDGLRRIRFTTSHPRDFGKSIVDAIDENETLCNHVHLPVQSGSDAVLNRMQRSYTRSDYLRRVEWMRKAQRDIAMTTDIIVGFPGETEAEFNETLRLIDEVEYDAMFIFKYSKRPNTPALQYEDHIPEEEKTRRFTLLQEQQRSIQIRRNARYVGKTEQVHVEGYNPATSQWIGRTSQHKTLNFADAQLPAPAGAETLTGRYLDVLVTRAGPNSLAGQSVF
jgi:tRNA-2-methylthio-N6-dimethylallyladenosine synthase